MQAESGEELAGIIRRKELERRAGEGIFFWGIGNAINFDRVLTHRDRVPVIFSKMISRPKVSDTSPKVVFVWRKYRDSTGLHNLPLHVLVTSRGQTESGQKSRHFALVCRSTEPLQQLSKRPFDPSAYRNLGGLGRSVGFSQVTALIRQVALESRHTKYQVDMQAILAPPFVVRLADPAVLTRDQMQRVLDVQHTTASWLRMVAAIRAGAVSCQAA
jgi:hypothetical protein